MLKEYLLEDVEQLERLVGSINSFNGNLEHLTVYENDKEFFNTYFGDNPLEAVRAAVYGKYRYNDDYVKFNGYGNLETLTRTEYEELLKDNIDLIIEEFQEYKRFIAIMY